MSKEFRKFYIGKNEEALFEEKAVIGDKEYFVGYTKEYVMVAKKTDENLENQIVSGRISGYAYRRNITLRIIKGCNFITFIIK